MLVDLVELRDLIFLAAGAGGSFAVWQFRGAMFGRERGLSDERKFVRQAIAGLEATIATHRAVLAEHQHRLRSTSKKLDRAQATGEANSSIDRLVADHRTLMDRLAALDRKLCGEQSHLQGWLRDNVAPPSDGDAEPAEASPAERQLHALRHLARNIAGMASQRHRTAPSSTAEDAGGSPADPPTSSDHVFTAIASLAKAAASMQEEIVTADNKLREQTRLLEHQTRRSSTDALTGLMNRGAFDEEIARCDDLWRRGGRGYAVALLDIDHFKRINDAHGHAVGDEVLKRIAAALADATRPADFLARYGGEEFAIRFVEADRAAVQPVVARTLQRIRDLELSSGGARMRVTVSGGVAFVEEGEAFANLINRADEALYAAKRSGRNRCFLHHGVGVDPWIGATAAGPTSLPAAARAADRRPPGAPAAPASQGVAPASAAPPQPADDPGPRSAGRLAALGSLCTRTVFFHGVGRRLAACRDGGRQATVILVHVDPPCPRMPDPATRDRLHLEVVRLLELHTRAEDLRCDFDHGIYAALLEGTGVEEAATIAARIRAAANQIEAPVRGGKPLAVRANVAAAEVSAHTTVELISRATQALEASIGASDNMVHVCRHDGRIVALPVALD